MVAGGHKWLREKNRGFKNKSARGIILLSK
jgi:hypothetical protein